MPHVPQSLGCTWVVFTTPCRGAGSLVLLPSAVIPFLILGLLPAVQTQEDIAQTAGSLSPSFLLTGSTHRPLHVIHPLRAISFLVV